jgi:hypothetical protein
MTLLLEALTAAAKVGFDAPKCGRCDGHPHSYPATYGMECPPCSGTGLDASDPFGLIGRALGWLELRACDVLHRWPTNEVIVYWDVPVGAMPPGQVARELVERHKSTPESRATALLRLVARVGAPQETP